MVKVPNLRRRQGTASASSPPPKMQSITTHKKQHGEDHFETKESSSSDHVTPDTPSQLGSSLRSSSQLECSIRSSSQVSTINLSPSPPDLKQEDYPTDVELGDHRPASGIVSSHPSQSAPSSMHTNGTQSPPSVVLWHASSIQGHGINVDNKRTTTNLPPNTFLHIKESQPHPISNAMLDASDLTHTSTATTSWGFPSDPRKLPVYLMPLAVMPLICLVGSIMILILIGVVIESYLS